MTLAKVLSSNAARFQHVAGQGFNMQVQPEADASSTPNRDSEILSFDALQLCSCDVWLFFSAVFSVMPTGASHVLWSPGLI